MNLRRRSELRVLTGTLVALRAFERDDMKLLHEWQNDEELMRLARSFPDHTISMEAVLARYDKAGKGESYAERDYIMQEKSSGKPIGWAGSASTNGLGVRRRATSAS